VQSYAAARTLSEKGVETTVVSDSAVFAVMVGLGHSSLRYGPYNQSD
jgi:translation initiation factor 2B subunit (eIF-2B alpha/beta/delta family)